MRATVGAAVGAVLLLASAPLSPAPAAMAAPGGAAQVEIVVPALSRGVTTVVRTRVRPARAGRPVRLERSGRSGWVTVATAVTGAAGRARLPWTPRRSGATSLRVVSGGAASLTVSATVGPVDGPRLVEAAGQRQLLDCAGRGGPTVVLVSGVWGTSADWADQTGPLRRSARTCVYDRPGLGGSPARAGSLSVDAGVHADELAALLRAAGEPGPFLLVGHSYGGLVVRAFAARYPHRSAGLVLLDAVPAGIQDRWDGYGHTRDEGGTVIDYDRSGVATGGAAPLASLPLVVVAAGTPLTWAPSWVRDIWTAEQDRTARMSSDSVSLVATGALHQLQVSAPSVVLAAITVELESVRRGTPLPGCSYDWSAVGARCIPPA